MRLHPVTGRNGYCGPAVMSALTAASTDECARVIREKVRYNRKPVKAMYNIELVQGLSKMGWTLYQDGQLPRGSMVRTTDKPTLNQWLRRGRLCPGLWILVVSGHFITVDTTGRTPLFVDSSNHRPRSLAKVDRSQFGPRSRVRQAWICLPRR